MRIWTTTSFENGARSHARSAVSSEECLGVPCGASRVAIRVPLCEDCLAQIPPVDWPVCRRCAAHVPDYPGNVATCPRCESDKLRFDATYSLGHYDGLLKELDLADENRSVGADWADICETAFVTAMRTSNSATLAADARCADSHECHGTSCVRRTNAPPSSRVPLGRELGIPSLSRLLQRSNHLAPQHELSRSGRFRNVRGGYRVRSGYQMVVATHPAGRRCDDHRGHLQRGARILKRRGAARITVLVVARTPNQL